jgi:hypothetical protein
MRRLDLGLSNQNKISETSDWFTPPSDNFELSSVGVDALLVSSVEKRSCGSCESRGVDVPVVNTNVLDTTIVGAVAFEGDPIRMAFHRWTDCSCTDFEYRIKYTPDFTPSEGLDSIVGLPEFFRGNVVLESAYKLLDVVQDDSPEWMGFIKLVSGRWEAQLVAEGQRWQVYVRQFRGKPQIPKRTFWQNRRGTAVHKGRPQFKEDPVIQGIDGGSS